MDTNHEEWEQNQQIPTSEDIRRSERIANRNQPSTAFSAIEYASSDPQNEKQVITSEDSGNWEIALQEEMSS